MVLSWFESSDISELIARRKYSKAAAAIREQLKRGSLDPRLRMQLGDVLIMAGRGAEAVHILTGVADEFASQGEAAKAIALLKKIQRADPGCSDVEAKLARLIKKKNKPRPKVAGYAPREGSAAAGFEPAGVVFGAETLERPAVPREEERIEAAREASWVPSTHQEEPAGAPELAVPPVSEPTVPPVSEPTVPPVPELAVPPVPAAEPARPAPDQPEELPFIELPPEPEVEPSEEASEGQLLDAIQDVIPTPAPEAAVEVLEAEEESQSEVIETPLFKGFSEEELVAVMRGLKLVTCEPGDIIITEGDAGDSLYVLTTGTVKTFVKNHGALGQRLVRTMSDGAFFGEISILSGKPRTATVTAATPCELLELDRATLDGITRTHPHVHEVLEEFYIAKATTQDAPVTD